MLSTTHRVSVDPVELLDLADHLENRRVPEVVTCLPIAPQFDCFDVAQILTYHGYKGQLRILPVGLPKPQMMIAEARRTFPDLDIDVLAAESLSVDR